MLKWLLPHSSISSFVVPWSSLGYGPLCDKNSSLQYVWAVPNPYMGIFFPETLYTFLSREQLHLKCDYCNPGSGDLDSNAGLAILFLYEQLANYFIYSEIQFSICHLGITPPCHSRVMWELKSTSNYEVFGYSYDEALNKYQASVRMFHQT